MYVPKYLFIYWVIRVSVQAGRMESLENQQVRKLFSFLSTERTGRAQSRRQSQ